ncbi:uncharacterized protein BYT42DRAFT_347309 [Radiomyces spectabilis]|uniref:uncharacterized protein n=1 Tax=Radiomyces spectabilis TaxID=64574 RepID=UPI002220FDED|nr:uncharacterized protein BYT42DRAFT_347309 [Radiomyces spectabilis]KAI8377526.1 hypothetical protein BYT42DRAFT_347309 [Radiomyces spectabilis]
MAFDVPETILLQILSYLPLPQRWQVGRVNRTWHRVSLDPYLYRDLLFENLEFKELLWALQRVIDIAPRVRTLTIDRCYSNFIQNIVVPVHFSNDAPKRPQFFSHIRTLQPARRRQEYLKHGFELHNQFSDAINQLLEMNQNTLVSAKILNCDLDFEMTELFCAIACFGQQLTTFEYANNGDKGLHSSGLLQAIVTSCPNMRHFRGLHAVSSPEICWTIPN